MNTTLGPYPRAELEPVVFAVCIRDAGVPLPLDKSLKASKRVLPGRVACGPDPAGNGLKALRVLL